MYYNITITQTAFVHRLLNALVAYLICVCNFVAA